MQLSAHARTQCLDNCIGERQTYNTMTNDTTVLTQEHKDYLEELRDSGQTNMWGATPYLEARFNLTHKEAGEVLVAWIQSFRD